MAEGEAGALDDDEPGLLGGIERVWPGAQGRGRSTDQPDVLGVVRGGDEEQPPRLVGKAPDALVEDTLELSGHGQLGGQRLVAGELRRVQRGGQLHQGQRIAVRLGEQAIAHRGRGLHGAVREQLGGRAGVEARDGVRGHADRVEVARLALARAEQEHDPLGVQPSGDELQRVR